MMTAGDATLYMLYVTNCTCLNLVFDVLMLCMQINFLKAQTRDMRLSLWPMGQVKGMFRIFIHSAPHKKLLSGPHDLCTNIFPMDLCLKLRFSRIISELLHLEMIWFMMSK